MKFPITRECLKALDPQKEKKEKYEFLIQTHIKSLVSDICRDIEFLVLYEIPSNQNPKYNDSNKKRHDELIRDKRYIWDLKNIRINPLPPTYTSIGESILIPRLVEKLKETFIGCDIIVDPLKTYLIIDWS